MEKEGKPKDTEAQDAPWSPQGAHLEEDPSHSSGELGTLVGLIESNTQDGHQMDDADDTIIQLLPITKEGKGVETLAKSSKESTDLLIDMIEQSDEISGLSKAISATTTNTFAKQATQAEDGFVISWSNLNYVLEPKRWRNGRQVQILNNLSGSFRSGELSAVLGPSGAGKSSLISCLLGKRASGVTGCTQLSFDNTESIRSKRPLKVASVPQKDHLLDTLTVMEAFMFASQIKNAHLNYAPERLASRQARDRKPFDHHANVKQVLEQLNIGSCAKLRCGKLSGGQYKRVAIGLELLSRPDLMILDEPTSGLDSITSLKTIRALRQLVGSSGYPMAVVAIIHQPDIDLFNLFHKAYVLAFGGRAIYEGPTDGIFQAVRLGMDLVSTTRGQRQASRESEEGDGLMSGGDDDDEVPLVSLERQLSYNAASINPARLIVEVAAGEYGSEITDAMTNLETRTIQCGSLINENLVGQLGEMSKTSKKWLPLNKRNQDDKIVKLDGRLIARNTTNYNGSIRVFFEHVALHAKRSWLTIIRDPILFTIQCIIHIVTPLVMSYAFGNVGINEACPQAGPTDLIEEAFRSGDTIEELRVQVRKVSEHVAFMYFGVFLISFAILCVTSLTFPLVMHVLVKEYRNGWYSMSTYFLGKSLADIPVTSMNAIIFMGIIYQLTGQPASSYGWRFVGVIVISVLVTLTAQTQGLLFSAVLMGSPQAAVFFSAASTIPLAIVCGFFVRVKELPILLQSLSKLSYLTHFLNGYIILRYGFNRCPCQEEQFTAIKSHQIPHSFKGFLDIWVNSFGWEYSHESANEIEPITSLNGTQTHDGVDVMEKVFSSLSKAKTYGHSIDNCDQMEAYAMLDHELNDSDLGNCFVALVASFFVYKLMAFILLSWKINRITG